MANEINGSVNVHMTKSGIDLERTIGFILDMAGTHHNYTVVDVTNVAANIPFGSVVNPGLLLMHNREAPGGLSVDHGKVVAAAFEATGTIMPGSVAFFQVKAGTVPQLKASGAGPAQIEMWLIEL
jgi:hypothetical protein